MEINVKCDSNVEISINNQRNYDGRELKPGEVLVGMDLGQVFITDNVKNSDSIKTYVKGNSSRKVVLTAIPEEFKDIAKAQFNFIQNEDNGKYRTKGEVSRDEMVEDYDMVTPDPLTCVEAMVEDIISRQQATEIFLKHFNQLLEVSPKHAYAFLLVMQGIKGKDFQNKMKLGHEHANTIRKEAERLYNIGLGNINIDDMKAYKTKYTEYYISSVKQILNHLMEMI